MKNLDEIVRLSDKPWIQERHIPQAADLVWHNGELNIIKETPAASTKRPKGVIWLPLGYNPETGNYQLDDLLIEAGNYEDSWDMKNSFEYWLQIQDPVDGADYDNPIIAKLTWLNELVEGKG